MSNFITSMISYFAYLAYKPVAHRQATEAKKLSIAFLGRYFSSCGVGHHGPREYCFHIQYTLLLSSRLINQPTLLKKRGES
jgi:hypothetical protein